MGNSQSVRSSHFHHPEGEPTSQKLEKQNDDLDLEDRPFVNISNKMVERLVEDTEIHKQAMEASKPRSDTNYHDKLCSEHLRILDETHSERLGMLPEDLDAVVERINFSLSKMPALQPACENCENEIINCYANESNKTACNIIIEKFKSCVMEETSTKLKSRIADMEEEQIKKSRGIEKAKKYNNWGSLEIK